MIRVRNLQLTALDDGRDALLIDLDDDRDTRLTFYGHLLLDQCQPRKGQTLQWELHFQPQTGQMPYFWGTLSVGPDHGAIDDGPIELG